MTSVDPALSRHQESPEAGKDFKRHELKMMRTLLRRLRYLEAQVRDNGGIGSGSSASAHAEWEHDALEYALTEIGYLAEK